MECVEYGRATNYIRINRSGSVREKEKGAN